MGQALHREGLRGAGTGAGGGEREVLRGGRRDRGGRLPRPAGLQRRAVQGLLVL